MPGFIYVSLPETTKNIQYKITFSYKGETQVWILFILTVLVILFSLEQGLLNGVIMHKLYNVFFLRAVKRFKERWEYEEPEE